jgi:putative peptidoglycan lipid II flippase
MINIQRPITTEPVIEVPMIRPFLTVSTGTLASRLLGFARDSMIAALLGAGPVADAFLAAFQLVNVVRRVLTEGALNAALVPAWLRMRDDHGASTAAAFAGQVLGTISATLIALSALIGVSMPLVIAVLAPGFVEHGTLQLAVTDARLMLPYLAFAGPATVLMALLSAQSRFAMTAFSPLLFNIALISVTILLLLWQPGAEFSALMLATTVGVAGFLQLVVLLLNQDSGMPRPLRVSFAPEMRRFFAKAGPGMVASSGPQWLVIAGAIVASSSPAAVSWLYFANRLIELPLGIAGVAMGAVLVPEMTRASRGHDRSALAHIEMHAVEVAVALAFPATVGLMILSEPIVQLLFEHGAFTPVDTASTAQTLTWLALALPAHILIKALAPSFFAREDTMTPLRSTLTGFFVAGIAALALDRMLGPPGIAAGIAIGGWSSTMSLLRRSPLMSNLSIVPAARRRLPRICLAALFMGGLLLLASHAASGPMTNAHYAGRALILLGLVAGGIAVYAFFLQLFGVIGWRETVNAIRQSPSPRDLRT